MLNKNRILCLGLALLAASFSRAQVVSPSLIKDPKLRSLQIQYTHELSQVGNDLLVAKFDYPFYLSPTLYLDQPHQQRPTHRSLPFQPSAQPTVLPITA